ncbi:cell division protein FtsX [Clostridium homopropionicum DSM 5847]|uniref:Cell division protein FtsX n=1 Tax=Clostridium homopropionicum DSM 5847 TaxID=1121318 RepID=A0A0L6Z6W0_9CLOT|nr:permease-like cell division protein FtsX [Clostridium homopropionicum]KOA18697.1 cell division protein FtsX [Clostridium homopropionicum DSM 5847]SFG53030.1 cell division protein FtsX [Clostridium homopropionicum]
MKSIFYNLGYFFIEAKNIMRLNLLSNILSIIGTGLILFLLGMVVSGFTVSDRLVNMLQGEAEISVFFNKNIDSVERKNLVEDIKKIDGVLDCRLIGKEEAYNRMKEVLVEEAHILELLDKNPFEEFIEVRIQLDQMDNVLNKVKSIKGIDYVRDNREVLGQLKNITEGLKVLGFLVVAAVGITTIVIVSHMIRQGIYNNKDQINTLRLLGAPISFIGFPFVLVGLILTLIGGILASSLAMFLINRVYGEMSLLPFMPLPPRGELIFSIVILIMTISIALGVLGSILGLISIKNLEHNN